MSESHPTPDPAAAAEVEHLLGRVFAGIPWMRQGAVFTLGDTRDLMLSAFEAGRKFEREHKEKQ